MQYTITGRLVSSWRALTVTAGCKEDALIEFEERLHETEPTYAEFSETDDATDHEFLKSNDGVTVAVELFAGLLSKVDIKDFGLFENLLLETYVKKLNILKAKNE